MLAESVLFLSAEMPNGLGLLLPKGPHRKTSAQLLQCVTKIPSRLWARASQVSILQWLQNNHFNVPEEFRPEIVRNAVKSGHVEALRWFSRRRSG